ncbi:MAG: isoprenylcysteine carboxylmethyltransferase family protein [Methylocapsa sp.]|nr:isoprenylcysteine carboxylmethyltransferase family protein [Methylocapsa sp.]
MQQGPWGTDPAADRPKLIASPNVIFVVVLLPGLILNWFWSFAFLPRVASGIIGFFAIFIAANIMAYAAREMVRANANVREPATAIATEWPFSVSRNPYYGGMVLLGIGIACFVNSIWVLILTPVLALALQKAVIEPEEAYLEQKFGETYLRYKARVRRWI